ncbi:MAG TPA: hypothetical protein V6D22_11630 [Candidatus Obscuribacterales bacterium]
MNRIAANNRRFAILLSTTMVMGSAGTAAFAAPVHMFSAPGILAPIYMNYEDTKGDGNSAVQNNTSPAETPTESMSLNFTKIEYSNKQQTGDNGGVHGNSAAGSAGKADIQEIHVIKTSDQASPNLFTDTGTSNGGDRAGMCDGSVDIPLDDSSSATTFLGGGHEHSSINGDGKTQTGLLLPAVQTALNAQTTPAIQTLQHDLQGLGGVIGNNVHSVPSGTNVGVTSGITDITNHGTPSSFTGGLHTVAATQVLNLGNVTGGATAGHAGALGGVKSYTGGTHQLLLPAVQIAK